MNRHSITQTVARGPGVEQIGATRTEVPYPRIGPDSEQGVHGESSGHEGRRQTGGGQAGFDRLTLKPYWGKPAYGILGEAMETSASFEARSAPLPYPTPRLKPGTAVRTRRATRSAGYSPAPADFAETAEPAA